MRALVACSFALASMIFGLACGGSVDDRGGKTGAVSGNPGGEHDGGTGPSCSADVACTAPSVCEQCPDGTFSCASAQCVGGTCEVYYPACGGSGGAAGAGGGTGGAAGGTGGGPLGCSADSQCAAPAVCQLCADGVDYSCATAMCVSGTCEVYYPACPAPDGGAGNPMCGGFGGFACPGLGTCVDKPNDGCDPNKGGADCPGMCLCNALADCAPGYGWDGSPGVCACVPVDAQDGGSAGCSSDAQCPQPGAPCKVCPDGVHAACPNAICNADGTCGLVWTTCP